MINYIKEKNIIENDNEAYNFTLTFGAQIELEKLIQQNTKTSDNKELLAHTNKGMLKLRDALGRIVSFVNDNKKAKDRLAKSGMNINFNKEVDTETILTCAGILEDILPNEIRESINKAQEELILAADLADSQPTSEIVRNQAYCLFSNYRGNIKLFNGRKPRDVFDDLLFEIEQEKGIEELNVILFEVVQKAFLSLKSIKDKQREIQKVN